MTSKYSKGKVFTVRFQDLNLLSVGHTIQLAGAVYQGEGKSFVLFFPEDKNDLPLEVLELTPEEWKTFLRQTDLLETEIHTLSSDGVLAKAIARKSQRQIDQVLSWRVFKRDRYRCRYCGNDDVPLTVDHVILWEMGGPTIEQNLLTACKKCNKTRGNVLYSDWLEHSYYKRVSQNLDDGTRNENLEILGTLTAIPYAKHMRSR